MGKKSSKARQMLQEQIRRNNELLASNNNEENMFLQAMSIEKQSSKRDSKYPSKNIKIKVDLNDITEEDVVNILDFKSPKNKNKEVQQKKLKTLNLLVMKDKNINRVKLESSLARNLSPFFIPKEKFQGIVEKHKEEVDAKKQTLIKRDLVPYFINYLKFNKALSNEPDTVYFTIFEEDRAFKILKYYYSIDSVNSEQALAKIDVRQDLMVNIQKKLDTISN